MSILHSILRRTNSPVKFCTLLLVLGTALTARAATVNVTIAADDLTPNDGSVSLREAITAINAGNDLGDPDITAQNPGTFGTGDTINFNIPGTGVQTIAPVSQLPSIASPVVLDGYTQPGASANTLAVGDNANLLIELSGASAGNVNGLTILTGNSIVRGLVINGFQRGGTTNAQGIILQGGDGNQIDGNFIGTDVSGTAAVGNGGHGIDILSGNNHVIGGTSPGARNIISGNAFTGIRVNSLTGILIQGNFIGTERDGSSPLGNGANGVGFEFAEAGSNNLVGGTVAGAGNVIANNGANGVALDEGITTTPILGNSIFANGTLGIDLTHSGTTGGVTLNDLGDSDTAANNLQNYPIISGLTIGTGDVTITGTLNSEASKTYRLEFFANPSVDPSGYGEGQTFLGFKDVTTDGSGDASFSVTFATTGTSTAFTATATDPDGNTSEFSAAFTTKLLNISTRMQVLTDDNVLIGGFIVTGISPKKVIVRAIGPSLTAFGVPGALADPTLDLNAPDGSVTSNDDWKESQQSEIEATGLQPTNDAESAILQTLVPGAYTAIVRGANGTTGVGLVEAYDLDQPADSKLANISTRGFIDTGDNVMIGGFIIGPDGLGNATVLVRAIGPSLTNFGVANALQDPTLELHDGSGTTIMTNENWRDTQESEITASGLMPSDDRESAILTTLTPGGYTAIVRGALDTTGVGLVEVYHLARTCVTPPANLVGWWPGDGNSDDISGGNKGTLTNGVTFAPGEVSNAFSLDGVNDSVVVPQTPATNSEITLDAWVYPTTLNGPPVGPVVFEKGASIANRIGLQINAAGQLCGYLNSDNFNICSPVQTIPEMQFTHVAIAFSDVDQQMRLYANGVLVAQTSGSDTLQIGTAPLVIGDSETSGTFDNFAGLIDEVEIFDRALSAAEIQAIYNAGSFGKCKP